MTIEMTAKKPSVCVEIAEGRGVEGSLRKFKRLCESFGVVREYRKRQDYRKPSVRLKEKTEAAVKRRIKNEFKVKRHNRI